MLDPSLPVPLWLVWPYLTYLERLLILTLVAVSIYVLVVAATTISAVRQAGSSPQNGVGAEPNKRLLALRRRSARVDKLLTATFYLFGVVLFSGLQNAYYIIDNSKATGASIILRNFAPHFVFAGNVFFILLVLHGVGWLITYRTSKLTLPATSGNAQ